MRSPKLKQMLLVVCLANATCLLHAWLPHNWVYHAWPYAYEADTDTWFWFYEQGNQWIYTYPPSGVSWQRLETSTVRDGWTWYSWPQAYSVGPRYWHYLLLSPSQWVAGIQTGQWSLFGHPVAGDPLETETIAGYITQTGNLNNAGLAVYDAERDRHLFSAGQSIHAFYPETGLTETVMTLQKSGRPMFLNIKKDDLYLIESLEGWLLHHNLGDGSTGVLKEAQFNFACTDSNSNLHVVLLQDGTPTDYWGLRRLSLSTNNYGSANIRGVENVNVTGSRYYFTKAGGTTILLRDSYSGMGEVDLFRFENQGIKAVQEMVVDPRSTGNYLPLIGLILDAGAQSGLYLLQLTGDREGILNSISIAESGTIHSLAFDGTYFYFINGSTSAAIYRVHKETRQVDKLLDVSSGAVNLNVVNHWLYFGERDSAALYRVHPVTRQVTALP